MDELLTELEKKAMKQTAELWNTLNAIVVDGDGRSGDLRELCFYIHGIQHTIMGQAAARAYPNEIRLLGMGAIGEAR